MTRDTDFMINPVYKGCDMSRELAKFLASQAVKSPQDSRYDINGKHTYNRSTKLGVSVEVQKRTHTCNPT